MAIRLSINGIISLKTPDFSMVQKILYLLRSIKKINQPKRCPNCGASDVTLMDSKYWVTKLLKCNNCKLNFRFPTDSHHFLYEFYQWEYKADYAQETTSITDFPADDVLSVMMQNNFPDKRNHSRFVHALLKQNSGKVLDYGSSWGYSVFHLKNAGYDAQGFEISKPRALLGKKLGVTIFYQHTDIIQAYNLIMSNHAIEHLPVISDFVKFASSKLTPEGIFMAFCPNGSPEYRQRESHNFHVNWGFLHPNYLDIEFAAHTFRNNPYLILTGDWDYDLNVLSMWDGRSQTIGDLRDGKELCIIAKPNINIKRA